MWIGSEKPREGGKAWGWHSPLSESLFKGHETFCTNQGDFPLHIEAEGIRVLFASAGLPA